MSHGGIVLFNAHYIANTAPSINLELLSTDPVCYTRDSSAQFAPGDRFLQSTENYACFLMPFKYRILIV